MKPGNFHITVTPPYRIIRSTDSTRTWGSTCCRGDKRQVIFSLVRLALVSRMVCHRLLSSDLHSTRGFHNDGTMA